MGTKDVGRPRVSAVAFNNMFDSCNDTTDTKYSKNGDTSIETKLKNVEQYSIPIDQFPINDIVHVADVLLSVDGQWGFSNTNTVLEHKFKTHTAWVYFMVLDTYIVRIGETQAFLFDRNATSTSKVRINKYALYNDGSEQYARDCLYKSLLAGRTVSFHAAELPVTEHNIQIGNFKTQDAKSTKEAEQQCFDVFTELTGNKLPIINRNQK